MDVTQIRIYLFFISFFRKKQHEFGLGCDRHSNSLKNKKYKKKQKKHEIGRGGDPTSNFQKKRGTTHRKHQKHTKNEIGLGCDPTSNSYKTKHKIKNEIGLGCDPNSNFNFPQKSEIGFGCDRHSNSLKQNTNSGLDATEIRI